MPMHATINLPVILCTLVEQLTKLLLPTVVSNPMRAHENMQTGRDAERESERERAREREREGEGEGEGERGRGRGEERRGEERRGRGRGGEGGGREGGSCSYLPCLDTEREGGRDRDNHRRKHASAQRKLTGQTDKRRGPQGDGHGQASMHSDGRTNVVPHYARTVCARQYFETQQNRLWMAVATAHLCPDCPAGMRDRRRARPPPSPFGLDLDMQGICRLQARSLVASNCSSPAGPR